MKRKRKKWRERTWRDDFIVPVKAKRDRNIIAGYDVHLKPSKYFSIARFGSGPAALKAARAYRDRVFPASGRPPLRTGATRRRAPFDVKLRVDNRSGLVGVCSDHERWYAWFSPRPGAVTKHSWSIKKFTHEGARMLAIAWRARMIEELR